jgi:hypothetical protein
MNVVTDKSDALTAIHTDLGAIFISLELSLSSWLITLRSPGSGEKMSKHSVPGGDFAGLMERFAQLQKKATADGSKPPEPPGVSPLYCRGVSSLYCAYKSVSQDKRSGRFTPYR